MAHISNIKVLSGNELSLSGSKVSVTGTFITSGDLTVNGTITANQLNINVTTVTSSIIYSSGSTKFGDTSDDTHQFTGSLLVSGNITVANGFSFAGSGANLTNIPNSSLNNSTVTIGTTSIALGGTSTVIQGLTELTSSVVTGTTGLFSSITAGTVLGNGSGLTSLNATQLTTGVVATNVGGTGQTTYTDGQLLIGNSIGNTLTKSTLTAGTNIGITNGNGNIIVSLSSSLAGLTNVATTGLTSSNVLISNSLKASSSLAVSRVTVNAPYVIASTDNIVLVNVTSSGKLTVTLPSPTELDGRMLTIKRIDLGAGFIEVTCSVNIDDSNSYNMNGPLQSITLVADSSTNKWFVV